MKFALLKNNPIHEITTDHYFMVMRDSDGYIALTDCVICLFMDSTEEMKHEKIHLSIPVKVIYVSHKGFIVNKWTSGLIVPIPAHFFKVELRFNSSNSYLKTAAMTVR